VGAEVGFTPWVSWGNRRSQPEKDESGVYLIGRFEQQPPPGPADPFDERVVYIGESLSERFQGRWRSFGRAAFKGEGGNRGGKKYRERFGGNASAVYISTMSSEVLIKVFLGYAKCDLLDIMASDLKVDERPKEIEDLLIKIEDLLIKYMERRLILLYSLVHGNRPICNGA
jgi:hypothetical protein